MGLPAARLSRSSRSHANDLTSSHSTIPTNTTNMAMPAEDAGAQLSLQHVRYEERIDAVTATISNSRLQEYELIARDIEKDGLSYAAVLNDLLDGMAGKLNPANRKKFNKKPFTRARRNEPLRCTPRKTMPQTSFLSCGATTRRSICPVLRPRCSGVSV